MWVAENLDKEPSGRALADTHMDTVTFTGSNVKGNKLF